MEIYELSLAEIGKKIRNKEISITELLEINIQHIEKFDPKINSFVLKNFEQAREKAKELEKKFSQNNSELYGIPLALKDIFLTEGLKTTCCSKILENHVAAYSSTAFHKLEDQSMILSGKLNMDEFAMGSSNETSFFGAVNNPWNPNHIPGGSSGGSAAAVAAGLSYASLGTDTGGSIRQPASHCGIVGLKPTYGRVSRYGVIAFASSLDQVGPMTKTVEDAAILLKYIAGHDPKDSTSVQRAVPDYTQSLNQNISGMKIGIPKEYFGEGIQTDVRKALEESISYYQKLGAHISELSLPNTEYAVPTYYIVAPAEASSNLARYDGVRYGYRSQNFSNLNEMYENTKTEGFGSEVKRRIMLGSYVLSAGYYDAYYLKAQKVRTLITQDFMEAFKEVDVLLTPTSPETAFAKGSKSDDPLSMYLSDIFTINVNLAGLPAISLPCGFDRNHLPIGMQLIASHFQEEKLIKVAHAFERDHDFYMQRPNLENVI